MNFLILFVSLLWLFIGQSVADPVYPEQFTGPGGCALIRPINCSDGNGGTFIGATTSPNPKFAWFFWTNEQGLVWSADDSVTFQDDSNDQYVLALSADETGNCLAVISEEGFLQSETRLRLVKFDQSGELLWQSLIRDLIIGQCSNACLKIQGDVVIISWFDQRSDSSGIWYELINNTTGQSLDESWPKFLTLDASHDATIVADDQLLIAAGDSLYVISLLNGSIVESCVGENFLHIKMIQFSDSILVAGFEETTGRILLECFYGNQFLWNEVITTGLAAGYQELNLVPCENGALVSYLKNHDLFYRIYNSVEGLGEERIICDAPEQQRAHKVIASSNLMTVIAWFDYRNYEYDVYIQHIVAGQTRWPNGYRVGSMSAISPWPPITLCEGGDLGWLVWTESGYCKYQPADSILTIGGTQPIAMIPLTCVLQPPYPNPFNSVTTVRFELPQPTMLTLTLYNVLGQEVAKLADGWYSVGLHTLQLEANSLGSGVYFLYLRTVSAEIVQKVVLQR